MSETKQCLTVIKQSLVTDWERKNKVNSRGSARDLDQKGSEHLFLKRKILDTLLPLIKALANLPSVYD